MRKYFLIIFILYWHTSSCQVDSVYARIEITSVSWEEHRTWIDTSIILTLEKFGPGEIISLGKIDDVEIGIQWELLKSRLGGRYFCVWQSLLFQKGWKMANASTS